MMERHFADDALCNRYQLPGVLLANSGKDPMTTKATTAERDSAQLEALGYDSKFDRSMSLWSNFALGFTYLSPVVGV